MTTTADRIVKVCDEMKQMLLDKNASYGDSVANPLRVFSDADNMAALRVRIDDKLSRIKNGTGYPGDDDVRDLAGYLLLYLALALDEPTDGSDDMSPYLYPGSPYLYPGQQFRDRDNDTWTVTPSGHVKMNGSDSLRSWDYAVQRFGPLVEV